MWCACSRRNSIARPTPRTLISALTASSSVGTGYAHTKSVLARAPWVGEFDPLSGVVFHEHMEMMPQAAE
jgi:hypothetical protein